MRFTRVLHQAKTYFGYIGVAALPKPRVALSNRAPITTETAMYAHQVPEQPTEAFLAGLYQFLGRSGAPHAALFRTEETLAHDVDGLGDKVVEFPPQTAIRPLMLRGNDGTLYVRNQPDNLALVAELEKELGPTPIRLVR